jgi:argininosuccinate lyase
MARKKRPESPTAAALDPRALDYSASVSYDWRLYPYDIRGSIAHARMLGKQGIISEDDATVIVSGLEAIESELDAVFRLADLEDIHLNKAALREKIGDAGARLHTARSRNDQVATDLRMFVKDHAGMLTAGLAALQERFCDLAEQYVDAVMPGYTHLQRAQPVLLAHHLLAYVEMFDRDATRFAVCHELADALPLGSGALAGVPYPIDRAFVAGELGFQRVSANSIDAVSDRDFVVDFHHAAALTMMHLSRFAEEIVFWSGPEFGFLRLPAGFATLFDHAAETEPGRRRTGARQDGPRLREPHGHTDDTQGAAPLLQPRSAGGQGRTLRLSRHPDLDRRDLQRDDSRSRVRHGQDAGGRCRRLLAGH